MIRQPLDQLRGRVAAAEPQFAEVRRIRGRIEERIAAEGDRQAEAIAVDFETMLTDLHQTFEAEFPTYAPPVRLQDIFTLEQRQQFEQAVNDAFRRYMAARVDEWRARSDARLELSLRTLGADIGGYGRDYQSVVGQIDSVIRGLEAEGNASVDPDQLPAWTRYASAAAGLVSGDVSATGVQGLEWREIIFGLGTAVGLNVLVARLFGVAAGPIALAVTALVMGGARCGSR